MGDAFEDFLDTQEEAKIMSDNHYYALAQEGIWVINDGKEVAITAMSNSHLNNAIKMLERDGDEHSHYPYLSFLYDEKRRRETAGEP